jgi:hypothetical protein
MKKIISIVALALLSAGCGGKAPCDPAEPCFVPTVVPTHVNTPVDTATPTRTVVVSNTPTNTPSSSPTNPPPTQTNTPVSSNTPTATATATITATATMPPPTPTQVPLSPTPTPTVRPTFTNTPEPTRTSTRTNTPVPACDFQVEQAVHVGYAGSTRVSLFSVREQSCGWSAVSHNDWIKISGPTSGHGDGQIQYSVLPRGQNDHAVRTGTMTIASNLVTVTQDGHP